MHNDNDNANGTAGIDEFGALAAGTSQFITFFLAGTEYGIEIGRVREILRSLPITKVPRVRIHGVCNLRGEIVPVLDLLALFGMVEATRESWTGVIIVDVEGRKIGLVAERMSETLACTDPEIRPVPGSRIPTGFVRGLYAHEGRRVVVLNVDEILAEQELARLAI